MREALQAPTATRIVASKVTMIDSPNSASYKPARSPHSRNQAPTGTTRNAAGRVTRSIVPAGPGSATNLVRSWSGFDAISAMASSVNATAVGSARCVADPIDTNSSAPNA